MEKAKKITALLLTVLLICAVFAACGESVSKDDPVIGTWQLSSVKVLDQEITAKQFLEQTNAKETPKFVFKDDGTVAVDILGNSGTSKWKANNDTYEITDDSDTAINATLKDNQLTLSLNGATMVFEKQK